MRRKLVAMDGLELYVSPLTFEQVEEFMKPLDGKKFDHLPDEEKAKKMAEMYRHWNFRIIAQGLTNAQTNGDAAWDYDRVRKELDPIFAVKLQNEIMRMSDLRREDRLDERCREWVTSILTISDDFMGKLHVDNATESLSAFVQREIQNARGEVKAAAK